MIVIDTNDDVSGKIPLLLKKGVIAVGRYYSSETGKRISVSEAEAIAASGLKLFMVFEDNGDPPLDGNAGSTDAKLALEQARAIGQPAGSAIYFAMEHLPNGYTSAMLSPRFASPSTTVNHVSPRSLPVPNNIACPGVASSAMKYAGSKICMIETL